jgi:hypothetical protein
MKILYLGVYCDTIIVFCNVFQKILAVETELGHVVVQASHWLPTMAAWVGVGAEYVEFMVDKTALGHVSFEYFSCHCQSSFHQFLHHHNYPGLAQEACWLPQCRVDPIGLYPLYTSLIFKTELSPWEECGSSLYRKFDVNWMACGGFLYVLLI